MDDQNFIIETVKGRILAYFKAGLIGLMILFALTEIEAIYMRSERVAVMAVVVWSILFACFGIILAIEWAVIYLVRHLGRFKGETGEVGDGDTR